jgi:hypothetical protein
MRSANLTRRRWEFAALLLLIGDLQTCCCWGDDAPQNNEITHKITKGGVGRSLKNVKHAGVASQQHHRRHTHGGGVHSNGPGKCPKLHRDYVHNDARVVEGENFIYVPMRKTGSRYITQASWMLDVGPTGASDSFSFEGNLSVLSVACWDGTRWI